MQWRHAPHVPHALRFAPPHKNKQQKQQKNNSAINTYALGDAEQEALKVPSPTGSIDGSAKLCDNELGFPDPDNTREGKSKGGGPLSITSARSNLSSSPGQTTQNADGTVDEDEREALEEIAEHLDLQPDAINRLLAWTVDGYAWMQAGYDLLNDLSR